MERMKSRLGRLEARALPPPDPVRPGRVTQGELRALEARIRRQEAGADEVRTAPEAPVVESVEPDEETAAVVRTIEWLESLDQADGKDRNG